MITPNAAISTDDVASHYNELDFVYREIWGEHVHHGYWVTGKESDQDAVENLVRKVAAALELKAGERAVDIGCGYGATARLLSKERDIAVTGVTLSKAQYDYLIPISKNDQNLQFYLGDYIHAPLLINHYDAAYSIESSEHFPDKGAFFDKTFSLLKPGGRFAICAWLEGDTASTFQKNHLLEPICREGRLPGMGSVLDYKNWFEAAGFTDFQSVDISQNVKKTWWICVRKFLQKLVTDSRYRAFLFSGNKKNRIFAVTVFRMIAAFESKAMRYGILTAKKPSN